MRANPSNKSIVFAVALALGLAGCATSGGSSVRPEGATANRIVEAELAPLGQISPIRAIERLRPRWLNSRSGSAPILHIDGARRGRISDLDTYQLSDIQQMEYMSASDATTRFGTGYDGGAILVTTR